MIETVIRIIDAQRTVLSITVYGHFDLRDAGSGNPNLFQSFGLRGEGYTPRPVFDTCRRLVNGLGV